MSHGAAIYALLGRYREVIAYRDDRLFTEFLPQGYQFTTLSSVDDARFQQVIITKFHLGMLITLLDDFADHPQHLNSHLLQELYKIPYHETAICEAKLNLAGPAIMELARQLAHGLLKHLESFPHYAALNKVFKFDLLRVYQANHYSELLSQQPALLNADELVAMRPFNMGIVAAGMIDVFASSRFNLSELGGARHVFHLGQRFGSICNNIHTLRREWNEGDVTNEIIVKGIDRKLITAADLNQLSAENAVDRLSGIVAEVEDEQHIILNTINSYTHEIQSFKCSEYAIGLQQLQSLHASMQGVI